MKLKVDSRKIKQGDTFLALRGVDNDGHNYIKKAIENGAIKIICEEGSYSVQTIVVKDTRKYLIDYLKTTYKEMIKDVKIIGVTGTNGKTTTSYLIYKLFNLLGHKTAYIGTLGFYINDLEKDLINTTPDIWDIFEMLNTAYKKGYRYLVMEVSSQGLALNRVDGLLFDYVLFTNLTIDHLDYHKTMGNYRNAKIKLFKKLKSDGKAIINNDDSNANNFLLSNNNNITYGFNKADFQINSIKTDISTFSSKISYTYKNKTYSLKTKLIGKYNAYNLIAALIVLLSEDINFNLVHEQILKLNSPPGRMEIIQLKNNNFVIVDYAHTPDAVLNILKEINNLVSINKLNNIYTVIGCGGNRDKSKRPLMGEIASKYSKKIILTSDNPRNENPLTIVNDMIVNIKKDNYIIELNRKLAIQKGIDLLNKYDFLLILGKGHEITQIINNKSNYFSDKEEVLKYIKK